MLLGNILFLQAGVVLVDVDGSSVTLLASDALWVSEEIEKHRNELLHQSSESPEYSGHQYPTLEPLSPNPLRKPHSKPTEAVGAFDTLPTSLDAIMKLLDEM